MTANAPDPQGNEIRSIRGARPAPFPSQPLAPQLATASPVAPDGDQWYHEIKLDGYRMLCHMNDGQPKFISRNGRDWTDKLELLRQAVGELPSPQMILDGEIVVVAEDGTTNFQALQNAIGGHGRDVLFYVFDLLFLDGIDLRRAALEDRKQVLHQLLEPIADGPVKYCDHLVGNGPQVFKQASGFGVEGIVSKRRDRPYRSGRYPDWLKIKCLHREEFVVGGYTKPKASRTRFGAIIVGQHDAEGRLLYSGRVGTGFSEEQLEQLYHLFQTLRTNESPFENLPADREAIWIQPKPVVQVEFGSWTDEGKLRHPSFQGMREDIAADDVRADSYSMERTPESQNESMPASAVPLADVPNIRFTNPDRLLYPDTGVTKLGLATHYIQVAHWMLPHIVDRPLSLVRAPDGMKKKQFYQKHAPQGLPQSIRRIKIDKVPERRDYLAIDDLEGLLHLVQFSAVELHVWGCRCDDVERPDRMVVDLDPDESVGWAQVVEAVHDVKALLDELQLTSFLKTTGGKGLHVFVPIVRRHSWNELLAFSRQIAAVLATRHPRRYTTSPTLEARRGKIYIDVLRNVRGATSVAAYSTRAKNVATVSVPINWAELPRVLGSAQYTVENLPRRLATTPHDPWESIRHVRQSFTSAIRKTLERLLD